MDYSKLGPWLVLLPTIFAFVAGAVRTAQDTNLSNTEKESKVLTELEANLLTMPLSPAQLATMGAILEAAKFIISSQVTLFNLLKIFGHKDQPPVVVPVVVPTVESAPTPAQVRAGLEAQLKQQQDHLAKVTAAGDLKKIENTKNNIAATQKLIDALPPA